MVDDAALVIQPNLQGGTFGDPAPDRWQERVSAFELLTGSPLRIGG